MLWASCFKVRTIARGHEGFEVDAGDFGAGEVAGAGVGAADRDRAGGDAGGGMVFTRGVEDCDYGDRGVAAFGVSAALCAGGRRDELLDRGDRGTFALPR